MGKLLGNVWVWEYNVEMSRFGNIIWEYVQWAVAVEWGYNCRQFKRYFEHKRNTPREKKMFSVKL